MDQHPVSLQTILRKYGLWTKQSLGQNFILDSNVTDRIVRSSGSLADVHVLEIGPGPGGLTRSILKMPIQSLTVIEKDERCVASLSEITDSRLHIIAGDALKINPFEIMPTPIKIIANLPYNISTELLMRWLEHAEYYSDFTLMFQKEVAARLSAVPHTKSYGRLSVMVQACADVVSVFDVPASVFMPPPKVTSTIVSIRPCIDRFNTFNWTALSHVTRLAFGQRRKMIKTSLLPLGGSALCEAAGINPNNRAEDLTVADFIRLSHLIHG